MGVSFSVETKFQRLNFHDLRFFFPAQIRDFFYEFIGKFLKVVFALLHIIFRDKFFLLEIAYIVMRVTPNVTNGNP